VTDEGTSMTQKQVLKSYRDLSVRADDLVNKKIRIRYRDTNDHRRKMKETELEWESTPACDDSIQWCREASNLLFCLNYETIQLLASDLKKHAQSVRDGRFAGKPKTSYPAFCAMVDQFKSHEKTINHPGRLYDMMDSRHANITNGAVSAVCVAILTLLILAQLNGLCSSLLVFDSDWFLCLPHPSFLSFVISCIIACSGFMTVAWFLGYNVLLWGAGVGAILGIVFTIATKLF
jgi:hypothetical protein